jgi:hypothetical protein
MVNQDSQQKWLRRRLTVVNGERKSNGQQKYKTTVNRLGKITTHPYPYDITGCMRAVVTLHHHISTTSTNSKLHSNKFE